MVSDRLQSVITGTASTPELALRWVISNPAVVTAMSGMSTMEQVEENCAVANNKGLLTAAEQVAVAELLEENKKLLDIYCTSCNYCMPCPQGVGIPQVLGALIVEKVWGLTDMAKHHYAHIVRGEDKFQDEVVLAADACIECGLCEPKCPQKLSIMEQLKEACELLGS
jgi:hypothetical protein